MPCEVLVGSSHQLVGARGVGLASGCQLSPNPAFKAVRSANSLMGVGVGVGVGVTAWVCVGLDCLIGFCESVGSHTVTVLEGVHWCGWLSAAVGILEVAKRQ